MRPSFDAGEGNGYDQDIHQSQGTGVLVQDDDHLGEQNWTSGDPSKQGKGDSLCLSLSLSLWLSQHLSESNLWD